MNERQHPIAWVETALRYLDALDAGDADAVAEMWERAEMDPKLEQILCELTDGLAAEEGVDAAWRADVEPVRGLLHEHLPSGFPSEADPPPLTVRDVAARLQSDNVLAARLSDADRAANAQLLANVSPIPDELGLAHFEKWRTTLGVSAGSHYWRAFRQAAVLLGMGRCQKAGELAAARRAGHAPKGERP